MSEFELSAKDLRDRCQEVFRLVQAGRCASGIVHDLNNFLGAIMAYADLIELDTGLGAEPRRMLGEIHAAVHRCSNLLNFYAVISREARPDVNMIDPGDLVVRTKALRRHRMQVGEIALETYIAPNLPPLVVDLPQMQLALLSLAINAEEALQRLDPRSGEPRRMRMTVEADGNSGVCFTVWNSGPAVEASVAERMFDPFTTGQGPGHLGLGLFTARSIAEAHRGSLRYDPADGFVLALPRDTGLSF